MAPVLKLKHLGGKGVNTVEDAEVNESHSQHLSLNVRKAKIKYIY